MHNIVIYNIESKICSFYYWIKNNSFFFIFDHFISVHSKLFHKEPSSISISDIPDEALAEDHVLHEELHYLGDIDDIDEDQEPEFHHEELAQLLEDQLELLDHDILGFIDLLELLDHDIELLILDFIIELLMLFIDLFEEELILMELLLLIDIEDFQDIELDMELDIELFQDIELFIIELEDFDDEEDLMLIEPLGFGGIMELLDLEFIDIDEEDLIDHIEDLLLLLDFDAEEDIILIDGMPEPISISICSNLLKLVAFTAIITKIEAINKVFILEFSESIVLLFFLEI